MRAKSIQEVVKMCGMNASIYCRIYVDVYEYRVFLLDTRATGGEQKLQLLNNVMPRRYVTKRGILLRTRTRNYMSGYISTTTVFHTRNYIATASTPRFLIAKVGSIAARDAMKMCKEVYLYARPCKRGLWAVSMYNERYAGYIKRPCYECGTATEQVWVYDNEFICGECKGRYETGNY